jgi:hypothetical protein
MTRGLGARMKNALVSDELWRLSMSVIGARYDSSHRRRAQQARPSSGSNDIDPCIQFAVCRTHLRDDSPVAGPFELVEVGPVIGQFC